MWTEFWDANTRGRREEKWKFIFIEEEEDTARVVFFSRFGHNPDKITCTCCGKNYSVNTDESLEELTFWHRTPMPSPTHKLGEIPEGQVSLEAFIQQDDVLVIRKEDIQPRERIGIVPIQGWIRVS